MTLCNTYPDRAIIRTADDDSFTEEYQTPDSFGMTIECLHTFSGCQTPQFDYFISSSCCDFRIVKRYR